MCITPLNLYEWRSFLTRFPHPDSQWFLEGLSEGFSIGLEGGFPKSALRNCLSAVKQPCVIDNYLSEEISFGSIVGPLDAPPFEEFVTNRFGVIPKSDPGKWRLITDLSFPPMDSVNSHIPDKNATVSFCGIPEAISKILEFGKGTIMAKFDIKRAYRLLPVHCSDRKFLGMKWRDKFYVDLALPFGLRSAPKIFSRFADVLQHVLLKEAPACFIQHYLDDFLILGKPDSDNCLNGLNRCISVCQQLGVPLAEEKTEGPSSCITYLGFVIDTIKLEISLPIKKVEKVKHFLDHWKDRKSGTKRKLLSLVGLLQHCSQAIPLSKIFLRRLIDRAHSVAELHYFVHLTLWERDDLNWWYSLFDQWNGRCLFHFAGFEKAPEVFVSSDSAANYGFGAIYNNEWFAGEWPDGTESLSISVKEMIPIVLAAFIWGSSWKSKSVQFKSDNLAVVSCLRGGFCRDRHLAFLLREVSTFAILLNFSFSSSHVAGRENVLADALSRFKFQEFFNSTKQTMVQRDVPPNLLRRLVFPPWIGSGNFSLQNH